MHIVCTLLSEVDLGLTGEKKGENGLKTGKIGAIWRYDRQRMLLVGIAAIILASKSAITIA